MRAWQTPLRLDVGRGPATHRRHWRPRPVNGGLYQGLAESVADGTDVDLHHGIRVVHVQARAVLVITAQGDDIRNTSLGGSRDLVHIGECPRIHFPINPPLTTWTARSTEKLQVLRGALTMGVDPPLANVRRRR
jgi:hypothetical protein